jgi:voltage-gated potassium channel
MGTAKRLLIAMLALLAILGIGTAGYMMIEGWNFLDSVYMTVITITTVGYLEVHPMNAAGRVFTIFLLIGGVGGALYTLTAIVQYVFEGSLGTTLGRRQMKNRIAGLHNHFILCGYGRVGHEIARVLAEEGAPFVVVDKDKEAIAHAEMDGRLYLLADAADETILKEAGIERARGLIVALGNDADSTYVTLSARQLNADLFIEARASTPEAEKKLNRAGASRIVSPYATGARRMAMLALRPEIADFLDTMSVRGTELQMETLTVSEDSGLAGHKVEEMRNLIQAAVLAITREDGQLVANPANTEVFKKGDRVIVLGTNEQMRSLEGYCKRCRLD